MLEGLAWENIGKWGKRWRGVNGARGKGIGERKDGAGSDFLGVISVVNIESRGGLWFGSKSAAG